MPVSLGPREGPALGSLPMENHSEMSYPIAGENCTPLTQTQFVPIFLGPQVQGEPPAWSHQRPRSPRKGTKWLPVVSALSMPPWH